MELLILPTWADLIGSLMLPILALFLLIAVVITRQRQVAVQCAYLCLLCSGVSCAIRSFRIGRLDVAGLAAILGSILAISIALSRRDSKPMEQQSASIQVGSFEKPDSDQGPAKK